MRYRLLLAPLRSSVLASARPPSAFRPFHYSAPAMSGVSKACCNIPPIISKGYQAKGEYKTINGLKTCKH